jgi:anaerobic magnesium-protoporphyrin IX monomethyl ester cyclase
MSLPDPRVLLLYPPNQSLPSTMCKPNGSLAYPSLAGSLREHGYDVHIYDACVGDESDDLGEVFYGPTMELPSGLRRTGVSDRRILEVAEHYDIIGITSIFTEQETMVLDSARLIKSAFPDKILVSGGVNARSRLTRFFAAGFDVVCLSEAENTILRIADAARKSPRPDFSGIDGIACRDGEGHRVQPARSVLTDLDRLPMPAWDLLPNERYWSIARPHGGFFRPGAPIRYASMMTSLGCPFHCAYCHIAGEQEGSNAGFIGKYRIKSDQRVIEELGVLKSLGIEQIFIEDDSLFGDKRRSIRLLNEVRGAGFDILDVNGVNVIHLLKRWKPDHQVLEALIQAGFTEIVLPFESGNQRVIRKYATNKLNIEKSDIRGLIKACKSYGLRIAGNYMLGYPDETLAEIECTVNLAKAHMEYGLDAANFFLVMPLPGTPLFDMACANGNFTPDFDADTMNWTRANMANTLVPADKLEEIRNTAWETINNPEFRHYKKTMIVNSEKMDTPGTTTQGPSNP